MGRKVGAAVPSFFGSLVKAGHGLPPVTAGIGVWLDGVGRAGTYGTAERMNGRTRLHRCREGVPIVRGYKEYLQGSMSEDKTQNVSSSAERVVLEGRRKGEVEIPARP